MGTEATPPGLRKVSQAGDGVELSLCCVHLDSSICGPLGGRSGQIKYRQDLGLTWIQTYRLRLCLWPFPPALCHCGKETPSSKSRRVTLAEPRQDQAGFVSDFQVKTTQSSFSKRDFVEFTSLLAQEASLAPWKVLPGLAGPVSSWKMRPQRRWEQQGSFLSFLCEFSPQMKITFIISKRQSWHDHIAKETTLGWTSSYVGHPPLQVPAILSNFLFFICILS